MFVIINHHFHFPKHGNVLDVIESLCEAPKQKMLRPWLSLLAKWPLDETKHISAVNLPLLQTGRSLGIPMPGPGPAHHSHSSGS